MKEASTDPSKQVKLGFLTGLVPRGKSLAFERILFRATRGNVFLRQAVVENPVTDPVSGEKVWTHRFLHFYVLGTMKGSFYCSFGTLYYL